MIPAAMKRLSLLLAGCRVPAELTAAFTVAPFTQPAQTP